MKGVGLLALRTLTLVLWPLLILLALWALGRVGVVVATVTGMSMYPTLKPGDRLLVIRHWPRTWLRTGDIVLLRLPSYQTAVAVKRITGLPDQTITSPNGHEKTAMARTAENKSSWYIPPGYCFISGDAPHNSLDSHTFGPVPSKCVIGLVIKKLNGCTQGRTAETRGSCHTP